MLMYRFPNATWSDVQDILYGARSSLLFPGELWGGMAADISIYTQVITSKSVLLF